NGEALVTAIRDAIERSRVAVHEVLELRALRHRYESLTRRERDVMALVVAGLLNKQVGSELGISGVTVKTHRGRVMRKMNAESLPDLVRMAVRLELQCAVGRRQSSLNSVDRNRWRDGSVRLDQIVVSRPETSGGLTQFQP